MVQYLPQLVTVGFVLIVFTIAAYLSFNSKSAQTADRIRDQREADLALEEQALDECKQDIAEWKTQGSKLPFPELVPRTPDAIRDWRARRLQRKSLSVKGSHAHQ
jgi:hypothetical protein